MYYLGNKETYCQIFTCPVWFYFTLIVCAHFCNEIERCQVKKSLKCFSILRPVKNHVRFEYEQWKISDFVSFLLFGFTLVIKLGNFNFESYWNTFNFFGKKIYTSDLNKFHGKMSDLVSFPLFGFTLVITLGNFDFESHWNTLTKKMMSDLKMYCQKVSDLVEAFFFE